MLVRVTYYASSIVGVPIGKLGLVPSGDRYQGGFSVYFVVLDASDKQSDLSGSR